MAGISRFSFITAAIFSLGAIHAAPAPAAPVVIDKIEAWVNLGLILRSDVERFRQTLKLRAQLDPLFSGTALAAKGAKATDAEITDFLINEKLITQQFPITDAEVEQEINSIQANNRIDRAALRKALGEQGFSFEEYFELIRISASKRNLIDRDIRTKVTVSDDDIKNYYYNNFSRTSSSPVVYKLKAISVATKDYKTPAAAREVLERALANLKSGESFEEVAKRVSDHDSAESGGELGEFTIEEMAPVIREQVKKLKIGEYSGVFGGPAVGAFYIVKVADMRSDDRERLEKMKDEIRGQLAAAEYQHQISLWLERQRQNAFVHKAGEPANSALPVIQ